MLTKQNGRPERTCKKQLIILSPSLSVTIVLCLSLLFSDTPANDMCRQTCQTIEKLQFVRRRWGNCHNSWRTVKAGIVHLLKIHSSSESTSTQFGINKWSVIQGAQRVQVSSQRLWWPLFNTWPHGLCKTSLKSDTH